MKNKYLGLIIARGGSKGLPRKNILPCAGKPLIQWTIEAAKSSKVLDKVILSTDDHEIASVAKELGCEVPFLRPDNLAQDSSTVADVVHHAIGEVQQNFSHLVLLQATSPCRTGLHIQEAISKFESGTLDQLVSVYRAPQKAGWILRELENNKIKFLLEDNIQQRQKLPALYYPNGSIYITRIDKFNDSFYGPSTGFYEMSERDSIDVDTKEDLERANNILS